MPRQKRKPDSPFTGRWRIVSMDEWDVDYVEEEGPAHVLGWAFSFDVRAGNSDGLGFVRCGHLASPCRLRYLVYC